MVQYYLGNFGEAMSDINKEIAVRPRDAEAYAIRGRCHAEAGQVDAALEDLDRALEMIPGMSTRSTVGAPSRRWLAGWTKRADFDAVLAIDPQNVDAFSSRGGMDLMTSRFPQAIEDLDQAIRLDPDNSNALLNRGMTYRFLKQFDQAIADFSRALAIEPGNTHLLYQRAVARFMNGQQSEALVDADQTIRSRPDHLRAHQLRAAALEATERWQEAELTYRRVLELDPGNEDSQRALQRLGSRQ